MDHQPPHNLPVVDDDLTPIEVEESFRSQTNDDSALEEAINAVLDIVLEHMRETQGRG